VRTCFYVSAEAFNLPLLPPSIPEESTGQFSTGANFAFFAATALSADFYKKKYNVTISPPSDLDSQLDSFKKVLARIAPGDGKCIASSISTHLVQYCNM
jgi:hypothetical protein